MSERSDHQEETTEALKQALAVARSNFVQAQKASALLSLQRNEMAGTLARVERQRDTALSEVAAATAENADLAEELRKVRAERATLKETVQALRADQDDARKPVENGDAGAA